MEEEIKEESQILETEVIEPEISEETNIDTTDDSVAETEEEVSKTEDELLPEPDTHIEEKKSQEAQPDKNLDYDKRDTMVYKKPLDAADLLRQQNNDIIELKASIRDYEQTSKIREEKLEKLINEKESNRDILKAVLPEAKPLWSAMERRQKDMDNKAYQENAVSELNDMLKVVGRWIDVNSFKKSEKILKRESVYYKSLPAYKVTNELWEVRYETSNGRKI